MMSSGEALCQLVCFGVRFSLYLASWLSDFDIYFRCVWFWPPCFFPRIWCVAPPPGSAPGTGRGCPPCPDVKKMEIRKRLDDF